jgi:hypothetical protein
MIKKRLLLAAALSLVVALGVTAIGHFTPAQAEDKGDSAAREKALTRAAAQLNQGKDTTGPRSARAGVKTPESVPSPKP